MAYTYVSYENHMCACNRHIRWHMFTAFFFRLPLISPHFFQHSNTFRSNPHHMVFFSLVVGCCIDSKSYKLQTKKKKKEKNISSLSLAVIEHSKLERVHSNDIIHSLSCLHNFKAFALSEHRKKLLERRHQTLPYSIA